MTQPCRDRPHRAPFPQALSQGPSGRPPCRADRSRKAAPRRRPAFAPSSLVSPAGASSGISLPETGAAAGTRAPVAP